MIYRYKQSTLQMTALLLETFLFWFRAGCELWICHFVPASSIAQKPLLHTKWLLLLSRILLFMLKGAKQLQPISYVYIHCCLIRMPTTVLHAKLPLYFMYQGFILLEVQSELWLTSCCSQHPATYCYVVENIASTICMLVVFRRWNRKF